MLKSAFKIIERWNLSGKWIFADFKIYPNEMLTLLDTAMYYCHFVGVQNMTIAPRGPEYMETV